MAQPRSYSQTTTFTDHSTVAPNDPHSGANLDTEFIEVKQNLDDLNTNIALLQRDDGKLNNQAVHKDSFDQDALALVGASGSGFVPRGDWAATTAYASGDLVTNNAASYLTVTAHTSGDTFAGDLTTYWTLIANSAIETSSASVNMANGDGSEKVFTTQYTYADVRDVQVFVNGALQATNLYSISNSGGGNNITFVTAPSSGTDNVIIWGATVIAEAAKAGALTYRDTAGNHATTASRWANLTTDSVTDADTASDSGEYSAKAYAIGGTEVTATSGKGAAKEWATTTGGFVDTAEYSAKEYAQGSHLAAGGSAKNWAQLATTPTTTATDASAKEWAVGTSTHKNDASAKEYATSPQYDSVEGASEYSAKHYSAQAQDWAVKTDGQVRNDANGADVDYSAKEWATDTNADIGSAKDWATDTGAIVASTDYSSKEWATGQLSANTSGSAKQWSIGGGNFVEGTAVEGSNYSAKKYASNASTSATAAASSATSAAADLATFQSLFHGASTSTPSSNVSDGDLWFDTNTGINVMKVYNSDTSAWEQLTPTSSNQTNINAAVADATDIGTVAGLDTEIGLLGTSAMAHATTGHLALLGTSAMTHTSTGYLKLVGDIDDKVTTVAGIAGNVTAVAGDATDIGTVATDLAGSDTIGTVAASIADVNRYANEYKIQSTEPGSPSEGDIWMDTSSNHVFKVHNGTAFVTVTEGQTAAEVTTAANNASVAMAIALG